MEGVPTLEIAARAMVGGPEDWGRPVLTILAGGAQGLVAGL